MSARNSIASYANNNAYSEARKVIDVAVLVQYLGDVDSISSLVQEIEDDNDDDMSVGVGRELPNMDSVFGALLDFNEEFMAEVTPQLKPFGIRFNRDVSTVSLTSGSRLVLKTEKTLLDEV